MSDTGIFIALEGGEGVGKSTQIARLAERLRAAGKTVVVTREPGGTEGAEAIRSLILEGASDRWTPETEALLFAAARADHVARLIRPALARGEWVISDRFLESSRAYQGMGSNLGDGHVRALHEAGSGGLLPDRVLILDCPDDVVAERLAGRGNAGDDRIELRDGDFHARVRAAFRGFAEEEPDRVRCVDASGDKDSTANRLWAEIEDLL